MFTKTIGIGREINSVHNIAKTFYGNNRQIVHTLFRGILEYSIVSFEILTGVRKINRLTRKPNNRITNIILLLIVCRPL